MEAHLTNFEKSIREVTAVYRQSKGLPPLQSDEIPASLRKERDTDTPDPTRGDDEA